MQQIRLLIISSNQGVRRGLTVIFAAEKSFEIVGEVEIDSCCAAQAQITQPDVILYADELEEDVDQEIYSLKKACPCSKVLVFADNFKEVSRIIAAGADGLLTRKMLPGDIVTAVELTCQAGLVCMPNLFNSSDIGELNIKSINSEQINKIDVSNDSIEIKEKFQFTVREMQVYKLIVQNCTNKEIGKILNISQPTVKSHVSSILHKMGFNNRSQLFFYVMQNGSMSTANTKIITENNT